MAFAKISRSSRSRRFSRRRRRSSSRSAVLGPSPRRPSSRSPCTTQLRIACAVGSNSRDNSSGLRPARTNSTIWRRNSGAYGGLDLGMVDTSSPKGSGVHEFGSTPKSRPLVPAARPILRERRNRPTISPRERWTEVHHVDPRVGIARVDVDVGVEFATLIAGRWGMEDVSPRADVGAMSRLSSAKVFTTAIADSLVDLHQMPVPGETTCPIRRTCPIAWAPPPSIPRDASRPDRSSPSP